MASVAPAPETALDVTPPGGGPDELRGPVAPPPDAEAGRIWTAGRTPAGSRLERLVADCTRFSERLGDSSCQCTVTVD